MKDTRPKTFDLIPHKYVVVDKKNPDRKKRVKGNHRNQNWTIQQAIKTAEKEGGVVCCAYDLTKTKFIVLDIDDDYPLEDFCNDMGFNANQTIWTRGNSKGYHIWVACDEKPSYSNHDKEMLNCEGDYLGEKVFERIDKEWFYKTMYPELEPIIHVVGIDDIKKVFKTDKICREKKKKDKKEKKSKDSSEEKEENVDLELIKSVCNLIDQEAFECRKDYLKIIIAMKNTGLSREYAIEFSKRSDKFDEEAETFGIETPDDFDDFWDYATDDYQGKPLTYATLYQYAKECNEEEFFKLTGKKKQLTLEILQKGAMCIAEVIAPKLKENLIYCNDIWYTIEKTTHLWKPIKKPSRIIVSVIHSFLNEGVSDLYKQLKDIDEDDNDARKELSLKISFYTSFYNKCDSLGFSANIGNHLSDTLRDDTFINKLDNNPGFLAYKNGILNLETKTFREGIKSSDFITDTIPFNYEPAEKEEIEFVEDVIYKICNNNEEHRDYYLALLGYSFIGKPHLEKAVYFLVGNGDNGKTLILECLQELIPCYVAKLDRKTFEMNYAKAHKHLKKIRGRRACYVEEMAKGKKLNIELIKEYGDGKNIENEIMFGTDENINIMSKLFTLSNHTPTFDVDGGVTNRYNQIHLLNNFSKDNKEYSYDKEANIHYHVRDNDLADKLKDKYRNALMHLIIEWANKYYVNKGLPKLPKEFEEKTKDTLSLNDGFNTWFSENCVRELGSKTGKVALQEASGLTTKQLNDELSKLGFTFNRGLTIKGKKGGWAGFKIVEEHEKETKKEENVVVEEEDNELD